MNLNGNPFHARMENHQGSPDEPLDAFPPPESGLIKAENEAFQAVVGGLLTDSLKISEDHRPDLGAALRPEAGAGIGLPDPTGGTRRHRTRDRQAVQETLGSLAHVLRAFQQSYKGVQGM